MGYLMHPPSVQLFKSCKPEAAVPSPELLASPPPNCSKLPLGKVLEAPGGSSVTASDTHPLNYLGWPNGSDGTKEPMNKQPND